MRRRSDDWINATHILKAAGFDKPARTRILERELQKGVHEKVQGGYGKYQGNSLAMQLGERYCGILLRLNDPRDMDSAPRRSSACGAQQYPRQTQTNYRFCARRPQPSSSPEELISIETESPQEYS